MRDHFGPFLNFLNSALILRPRTMDTKLFRVAWLGLAWPCLPCLWAPHGRWPNWGATRGPNWARAHVGPKGKASKAMPSQASLAQNIFGARFSTFLNWRDCQFVKTGEILSFLKLARFSTLRHWRDSHFSHLAGPAHAWTFPTHRAGGKFHGDSEPGIQLESSSPWMSAPAISAP